MNNLISAIELYRGEIKNQIASGKSTELSLRTPLENLLNALKPDEIKIVHEGKKEAYETGTPDFKVFRQPDSKEKLTYPALIGYVECKKIGEDLDKIRESDQIRKYLQVSPNIILTDYNRFMLLSFDRVLEEFSFFPYGNVDEHLFSEEEFTEEDASRFLWLLRHFFGSAARKIKSKKELVRVLSSQAFYLSVKSREYISDPANRATKFSKYFNKTFDSFKEAVNYDFGMEEFCDIFGQSIVYGLFVAHLEKGEDDIAPDTADVAAIIPPEFSLLAEFIYFSTPSFNVPPQIRYAIDNITETIKIIDKTRIAEELDTNAEGITIYLYEDFLKAYDDLRDTEKRKEGGVYYTPAPVVRFIIDSIHAILKTDFGIQKGFAEDGVKTLDFATGTGSFLAEVFQKILKEYRSPVFKIHAIKDKFLKEVYGFELMFVPYIVAHLKLASILRKEGFDGFDEENRLQVFLTNTLDLEQRTLRMSMPLLLLEEEYEMAEEIKNREEILVILGNPPYNVKSKNKGEKIMRLIESTYKPFGEKKLNWDDYVKFIRFAQWKLLEQNRNLLGEKAGVMGFVTNNSFIWAKTLRRMRESLYRAFDDIYILNLHGGKDDPKEDQNVFDIRTGVCISIFIKRRESNGGCNVYYYSTLDHGIFARTDKFSLLEKEFGEIPWKQLDVKEPNYWFIEKSFDYEEFEKFFPVDTIFSKGFSGIQTGDDGFLTDMDAKCLASRISDVFTLGVEDAKRKFLLQDKKGWTLEKFYSVEKGKFNDKKILPLYYKAFDLRYVYYSRYGLKRSRDLLSVFEGGKNVALACRRQSPSPAYCPLVVDGLSLEGILGVDNRGRETLFPLYYAHSDNLHQTFQEYRQKHLVLSRKTPEEIFAYIYGVLCSPFYRERYQEYLKVDYPKIPFVHDAKLFDRIAAFGKRLIDLHLMRKTPSFPEIYIDFTEDADKKNPSYVIEKMPSKKRYVDEVIYLNKDLCLRGVTSEVWTFTIGGYSVLEKWIKYRVGRECTRKELEHLERMTKITKATLEIFQELDFAIEKLIDIAIKEISKSK